MKLHDAVGTAESAGASDRAAALELTTPTFWYDGFAFMDMAGDSSGTACQKSWGNAGVVEGDKRAAFLDCAAIGSWTQALDGSTRWRAVTPKKLPSVFKSHSKELAKLARDHTLVLAHFVPAGPAESWNLYAVKKQGGKVIVAAALTVNKTYDEGE